MLDNLGFPNESFIKLIDSLECPSLEKLSFSSNINNMTVDGCISLFKRSWTRLKELKLHGLLNYQLTAEHFKKLLNAVPYLQHLYFSWDACNPDEVDDLLQQLSSLTPNLEGGTPGFLPHLESLTLALERANVNTWRHIPIIYSRPHRKLLRLELYLKEIDIDNNVLTKISKFIDEGVFLRMGKIIFRTFMPRRPPSRIFLHEFYI